MFRRLRYFFGLGIVVLSAAALGANPVHAAGVVGNGSPASCTETAFVNALSGGGKVTFNCGANPKTIVLTGAKTIAADTTIDGGKLITLSAPGKWHFTNNAGKTLTLKNLVLSNSNAGDGCAVANLAGTLLVNRVTFSNNLCAIGNYGSSITTVTKGTFTNNGPFAGGAIHSTGGNVTVSKSKFLNNAAVDKGGAIYFTGGQVTLLQDKFIGNHVNTTNNTGMGGAVYAKGVDLHVTKSTFTSNVGDHYGGAVYLDATTAYIGMSTFNGNTVTGFGGALYVNSGNATLVNSTLSGNFATAGAGAGVEMWAGKLEAIFVTIYGNHSPNNGSGIGYDGGLFSLQNSIVANNEHSDCSNASVLTSNGHNLSSDASCGFTATGDMQNKNPKLGSLAKNGGPTQTHLPQSASPVINKAVMPPGGWTDQRGVARPLGAKPDIGAVEAQ